MAEATRNPTGDDAENGTWDGTPGSRYTVVDDYPDSTGTDYLTHGTTVPGNLTFTFPVFSVPAGATGISVDVLYYDQKTAAQGCNIGGRLKVGGSYYNATTHNPANGTWTQRTDSWANNPKTAVAWTVDDINGVGANALEAFGWVSTDANPTIRLASIQLKVIYTVSGTNYERTITDGIEFFDPSIKKLDFLKADSLIFKDGLLQRVIEIYKIDKLA